MTAWFKSILEWIYGVVGSYGIAVMIFTVMFRVILTPFEVSSRKGMRKMAAIQPKLNELQKKYANDQAKLQQKQSELMRKEHYNPLSGCLPMLLQWPILLIMFYAMRDVASEKLIGQAISLLTGETPKYESFLWIKNVFMADSPFTAIAPDAAGLIAAGQGVWQGVFNGLSELQKTNLLAVVQQYVPAAAGLGFDEVFNFASANTLSTTINTYVMPALQQIPAYVADVAAVPGWKNVGFLLFSVTLFQNFNGLLILPLLSGVTQWAMTKFNPAMQQQPQPAGQQKGMGNFMTWFFPIFSVFICLSSNAGFALYWVTINIFATVQSILINKYLESKDAKQKALTEGNTAK